MNDMFGSFLSQCDSDFRHVPSRRYQKNYIEPIHFSIRSKFIRLKPADDEVSDLVLVIQAISISNILYSSDKLSSFALELVFSNPLIANQRPTSVNEILQSAHGELIAKRNLTLILRLMTTPVTSSKE